MFELRVKCKYKKNYKEQKFVFSHENFLMRFQVRVGREDISNHQLKVIVYLKLVMIAGLV
jgi:hypothetical protein